MIPRILNNANGNIPLYAFPLLKFFIEDQPAKETNLKVKCINHHCPLYNTILSEESWSIFFKRSIQKKIKAICPECLFSYIRNIHDDICIKVVGHGKIIKQLVRDLKNDGETVGSIASRLGLNNRVVEKILSGEYDRQEEKRREKFERDRKYHREIWTRALESSDFFTLRELYKNLRNTWQWLQRHDSIWLNKTNEPYRFLRRKGIMRKPEDVDGIMLKKLETINDKMLSESVLIHRSKSRFFELAKGFRLTNESLKQLPQCKKFIDEHAESAIDFRKRRIKAFILKEAHEDKLPTLQEVLLRFGLNLRKNQKARNELIGFIYEQLVVI
jgi:hypothetical protein